MKKLLLILFAFALSGGMVWGQTTIWNEDFNNSSDDGVGATGPIATGTNNGVTSPSSGKWTVDVTNCDLSATTDWFRVQNELLEARDVDGSQQAGGSGDGALWTSESIDISGYTNVSISVDFSSSGTFEDEDFIKASYKIDGGSITQFAFFNDDFSNQTVSVTGLSGSALIIYLEADNNSGSEYLRFDNVEVTGTASSGNDQTTEVYAPTTQIAAGTISSLNNTQGDSVNVFKMTIEDQGDSDGLPTHVTNIRVKPYTSNTADWTNTIQGVTLNDGSAVTIGTPVITDTYIDIPITSGNLDIADGGSKDVTLAIFLNTNGIEDGAVLSFMVDADDHGFTADASGSGFASSFLMGDFNSNDFAIDVEATQLTFIQQPGNVIKDEVMSPSVTVAFTDVNSNVDVDYDGVGYTIDLATTGTFSGSATTSVDASNGISTFDNLIFSAVGTGITITANDGTGMGNTSAISNSFDVFTLPNVFFSEYIEGSGSNKAIEIYNGEAVSIDLSDYAVNIYSNGASSPSNTWTGTTTLESGEVYILYNSSAGSIITNKGDETSAVTNFNGDDALELVYSGSTIDVFGTIGTDPGSSWDVAGTSGATADHTIVRKLSVTSGNTDWSSSAGTTTSNSEWIVFSVDHFDNLGVFGTGWGGTTNANWSESGNWDVQVPISNTNVLINASASNYPTIDGNATTPSECNNLEVESGASLTIPSGKALTVNGGLTNNATASGVVVESNSSGNGSLIIQGTITGDATVQRYFQGYTASSGEGWHEIGAPVAMTVAGSDFEPGTVSPNLDDLYYWKESDNLWMNWKTTSFDFVRGNGYLISYESDQTSSFTGQLQNSDYSFMNLSRDDTKGYGWHLIGNGYTSALEWNNCSGWNFYNWGQIPNVWDESAGTYVTLSPGDRIPSTNGFFLQVASGAGGNNELTIPPAARVHDAANNYKNSMVNNQKYTLVLKVSTTVNTFSNTIRVGFKEDATEQWDMKYDSHKLYGNANAPELWTLSNGEEFSANTLPFSQEPIDLPLNFKAGVNGEYTLSFEGLDSFEANSNITLEDLQTNQIVDLKQSQTYTYTASTDDPKNRFMLHFYSVTSTPETEMTNDKALIYVYNNNVIIKSVNSGLNGTVEVINLLGQTMKTEKVTQCSFLNINTPFKTGIYIVRYTERNGYTQTQKVVLN